MIKFNNKQKAFSLAEILISLLIISIILILALPVVTKKSRSSDSLPKGSSSVFYYNKQTTDSNFPCYVTTLDNSGATVVKNATGKCQIYEFTVPAGVHKVNLTLVAGGGGGGGAAGGTIYNREFLSTDASSLSLLHSRLKNIKINFLTGAGANGENGSTGNYKAGAGGSSGAAVVSFNLPDTFVNLDYDLDYFNEYDSTSDPASAFNLSYKSNLSSLSSYSITSYSGYGLFLESAKTLSSEPVERTGIFVSDADNASLYGVQCFKTEYDGTYSAESADWVNDADTVETSLCKLNASSYRASVSGKDGFNLGSGTTVASGFVLYGGEGGKHSETSYGSGGKGQSLIVSCGKVSNENSCTPNYSSASLSEFESAENVDNAYGNTTVSIEHPGGVGSGGAGGSAVKINGFSVTPGAKYTIVVGSGGAGGAKGEGGIISSLSNAYKKEPTAGQNGTGGSSTAIYDESGNLLLMAAGGVGGYGGKINSGAETVSSATDFTTYIPVPDLPDKARNIPLIISEDNNLFGDLTFDDAVVSSISSDSNDDITLASGLYARRIIYSFINNKTSPLFELNRNTTKVSQLTYLKGSADSDNDKTTGGFDRYYSISSGTVDTSKIFSTLSSQYNGAAKSTSAYNGLFFRYPVNNVLYYAGGLGGFSGLGTKAGCGGLFVGNYDGVITAGSDTNSALAHTFGIVTKSGTGNNTTLYGVDTYYGNCSVSTPDGQSAPFVAPSYTPGGAGEKLGEAGSGGGGGGWSGNFGAGNGGNGQNGYVMINWHN